MVQGEKQDTRGPLHLAHVAKGSGHGNVENGIVQLWTRRPIEHAAHFGILGHCFAPLAHAIVEYGRPVKDALAVLETAHVPFGNVAIELFGIAQLKKCEAGTQSLDTSYAIKLS
jgi:hypothetical protein